MMLLHHPTAKDQADSVFWIDAGELRSYAPEDTPEVRLATNTVMSKTAEASWESLFEWLESRSLTRDVWRVLDADDPRRAFEQLR